MNKIIVIYIKGERYNPMYKWNSVEEFKEAIYNCEGIPHYDDIVTEAYIDDNLIDMGNTFKHTLNNMKIILDI